MQETIPKVLIIDDDAGVLFLHKIILREGGLGSNLNTFDQAENALEFIFPLDSIESKFLIFLDLNMPKVNGWDFLDRLGEKIKFADIKVIIVTSSLSNIEREKSKEYVVVIDFWEKPMEETQVSALKRKLGGWMEG
jgi:CheY-like chemotaxis protein